jgi:branched-chain amino acid aminotransferase
MSYLVHNGKYFSSEEKIIHADNQSYRYGDGLFETMKIIKGEILLADFHFSRLFKGLEVLKYTIPKLFKPGLLKEQIKSLIQKNECTKSARIRLSVSRGRGGLYDGDNKLEYVIECWPVNESANQLNENGLIIGLFRDAKKSCDIFSNFKSANYLPYVMGAQYAKENKWNDSLILNQYDRVCDATIANIFWVKNGDIFTPPLSEGCVAGVMRKYLIESRKETGKMIHELVCRKDILENADEIFLTNAMYGIRWVKQFENKILVNSTVKELYRQIINPLFK